MTGLAVFRCESGRWRQCRALAPEWRACTEARRRPTTAPPRKPKAGRLARRVTSVAQLPSRKIEEQALQANWRNPDPHRWSAAADDPLQWLEECRGLVDVQSNRCVRGLQPQKTGPQAQRFQIRARCNAVEFDQFPAISILQQLRDRTHCDHFSPVHNAD